MELILRKLLLLRTWLWGPAAAFAAAGLLLLCVGEARSQENQLGACPTHGTWPLNFERATAGDSFVTSDGAEVRVAAVLAPGSDRIAASESVLAASRSALSEMVEGTTISLASSVQERDRYGHLSGQIFANGEWLQARLLRRGLVLAAPDIANDHCAAELLKAESIARVSQSGFWANGQFSVLSVEQLMAGERGFAGSFQIVEGTIIEVGDYRGRYFLNFGEDHQSDFTVTIAPPDMKNFRA